MSTRIDWPALYAALSEPFESSLIRYRAGATNRDKTKVQALPYVDPRAYEDRLNSLVPGDWHVTFEPWGNDRIICLLTVHGVTRSSTGEAGDSPDGIAGTSAEAQAFKRACAKFGLGRQLYAITPQWRDYDVTTGSFRIRISTATAGPKAARGIGGTRAERLRKLLIEREIPEHNHRQLASDITGRLITELSALTEHEAHQLWNRVSRHTQPSPGHS